MRRPFDLQTTLRLMRLKLLMREGIKSDWEAPHRDHITSQTCGAFAKERVWLTPWYVQLASILATKNVLLDDGKNNGKVA